MDDGTFVLLLNVHLPTGVWYDGAFSRYDYNDTSNDIGFERLQFNNPMFYIGMFTRLTLHSMGKFAWPLIT